MRVVSKLTERLAPIEQDKGVGDPRATRNQECFSQRGKYPGDEKRFDAEMVKITAYVTLIDS